MAEVEIEPIVPVQSTTIACWACRNQFTVTASAGTLVTCPSCQSQNGFGAQPPMMAQPMMAQPMMMPASQQAITVQYTPQPAVAQHQPIVVINFVKGNPYGGMSVMYSIAAFFIVLAFITPGWRKIVLETNTDHGLGWEGSGSWYTSVGIGVYQYVVSNPSDNWAPPVVGAGHTADTTDLMGSCTIGGQWYTAASGAVFALFPYFFDPANCDNYHKLQYLTLVCFFLTILIPTILFTVSSSAVQVVKVVTVCLSLAQEGFIVAIFIVSNSVNWDAAQSPPEYGDVHINTYAFSFAFFCLGAGMHSIALLSSFAWAGN